MRREILDPFAQSARSIVKDSPPVDRLPQEIIDLALKKVAWLKDEKRPPKHLLALEPDQDVLSFYSLFLAGGTNFTKYSSEMRIIKEAVYKLIKARLEDMESQIGERVLWKLGDRFGFEEGVMEDNGLRIAGTLIDKRDIFASTSVLGMGKRGGLLESSGSVHQDPRRVPRYGIPWKSLIPLLRTKDAYLTDWYVRKGLVISSLADILDLYARLISEEAQHYMGTIGDQTEGIHIPRLEGIARALREMAETRIRSSPALGKSAKLDPSKFPPCIMAVMKGAPSGSRNYAISVLLTTFLSYARIAPQKTEDPRITDYVTEQAVLDEFVPLIYDAAQRCNPPLFEDEPLEKMNVSYHLGLGLNEEPSLENSGQSKWYVPPNCEKVQREAPPLCMPDALCKKINNPITYYFVKMKDAEEKEEEEDEVPAGDH